MERQNFHIRTCALKQNYMIATILLSKETLKLQWQSALGRTFIALDGDWDYLYFAKNLH